MLLSVQCSELSSQWIRVGLPATVEVELPVEHTLGARCIHCEGRVVRVDSDKEEVQIALRFNNMSFRDARQPLPNYSLEVAHKYVM